MFEFGWGRGFGRERGGYMRQGHFASYCRAYPRFPGGWWRRGRYSEDYDDYADRFYRGRYYRRGLVDYAPANEMMTIRETLEQIADMLTALEKRVSEIENVKR